MEFQPWKDYFELASLVQKMARLNAAKPETAKASPIYTAEPTEGQAIWEDPTDYDSINYLNPFEDKHSDSSKPPDSYFQVGLPSSHNWNPNKDLAYYQYQPQTLDNNFQTEPDTHYRPSQLDPVLSQTICVTGSQSTMCHFCKHNGESRSVYTGHNLRDEQGKVTCPILRMYTCSLCGATGDSSHTRKYCPINKNKDTHYRKAARNSAGHGMRR